MPNVLLLFGMIASVVLSACGGGDGTEIVAGSESANKEDAGQQTPEGNAPQWVLEEAGTEKHLYSILFNGSHFVVGGDFEGTIHSADAKEWTLNPGWSYPILSLVQNNGIHYGLTDWGILAKSSDQGGTWETDWSAGAFFCSGPVRLRVVNGRRACLKTDADSNGNFIFLGEGDNPYALVKLGPYTTTDITYGKGLYVAVGRYGSIFTSADGETWTARDAGTNHHITTVLFGNERFLAFIDETEVLISDDGITWSLKAPSIPLAVWKWNEPIVYNNQFWFAGLHGKVYSSNDGMIWFAESTPTTNTLTALTYGAGQLVAIGEFGTIVHRSVDNATDKGL